jgi:hypothetical protein
MFYGIYLRFSELFVFLCDCKNHAYCFIGISNNVKNLSQALKACTHGLQLWEVGLGGLSPPPFIPKGLDKQPQAQKLPQAVLFHYFDVFYDFSKCLIWDQLKVGCPYIIKVG